MAARGRSASSRHPSACTKYTLGMLSLLFWLISIVLIGIGAYVLRELKQYIKEIADLQFQPSILFILVGILMFVITFIGFIGAVRENTTLLKVYSILLLFIILIVVAMGAVAFYFRAKLEETITKRITTWIPLYNGGDKYLDIENIINAAQEELSCCGAKSYNDWNENIYFNCSKLLIASRCGVPFSCCKKEHRDNRQCGYGVRDTSKLSTKEKAEKLSTINTIGCVEKGKVFLSNNWVLLGGIAVGFLVLLLVSMCLAGRLREQIETIRSR